MIGPPNLAVVPVTLTAILYPQLAVDIRYLRRLPKNSDTMKLKRIFQGPMKTWPFLAGVNFWGPGRYSDRSLFRQLDIPTGRCSDSSIFRQTGRYSDRSLFRQVDIPTGRYSDRSIFRQTGRYSDRSIVRQTGRYSDRSIVRQTGSIFRKVYIPTGRYSDIKIIVMRGLTTINSYCGDE